MWASSASAINAMEKHRKCARVVSSVSQHTTSMQQPYTSFSGIWLVPPGHVLTANKSGVELHCYHSWSEVSAMSKNPAKVFRVLEHSVKTRMDYSGVIGIPVSGGIDSGILAFSADKL